MKIFKRLFLKYFTSKYFFRIQIFSINDQNVSLCIKLQAELDTVAPQECMTAMDGKDQMLTN